MSDKNEKKKLWNIDGLNCFQVHTIEILLSEKGKLQYGTAIAPDGHRHSHTWIEKNGKIFDIFNWEEHKPEGYFDLPKDKETIDNWLGYAENMCDEFRDRIDTKFKIVPDTKTGGYKAIRRKK